MLQVKRYGKGVIYMYCHLPKHSFTEKSTFNNNLFSPGKIFPTTLQSHINIDL